MSTGRLIKCEFSRSASECHRLAVFWHGNPRDIAYEIPGTMEMAVSMEHLVPREEGLLNRRRQGYFGHEVNPFHGGKDRIL
jgi:hypothetical protein